MSDQVNINDIQEQPECCVCLEPAETKVVIPCNHPEVLYVKHVLSQDHDRKLSFV